MKDPRYRRTCTRCGDCFVSHTKTGPMGYWCKPCFAKYQRDYRKKRRDLPERPALRTPSNTTHLGEEAMSNVMNNNCPLCNVCQGFLIDASAPPMGGRAAPAEMVPGARWCPSCEAWRAVNKPGSYMGFMVAGD